MQWFLSCVRYVAGEVSPQHMENGIPSTRNSGRGKLKIFSLIGLCAPNADGLVLIEKVCYAISIDSTSNKAHQHVVRARKDASEVEVKQHIGTSRAG